MSGVWILVLAAVVGVVMVGCSSVRDRAGGDGLRDWGGSSVLGDLSFLSGRNSWVHQSALVEETWSTAEATGMVGYFRWLRPDRSVMVYELMSISWEPTAEDRDATFLRIRHFSSKLVAKEDKDAPMTLKLARRSAGEAEFVAHAHCGDVTRIVYRAHGDDVLQARVEFSEASGRGALEFVYRKQ